MKVSGGIPALGFGTYGRWKAEGEAAIVTALEVGYRHIDTAQSYDTEGECGRAVQTSGMSRDDLFVTTKIDPKNFGAGDLIPSLRKSLDNLQMDQVNLTLIHWPSPHDEVALPVYLEQLAEAKAEGLTKLIGVSNFTIALLKQAEKILGPAMLSTNQVELHPFLQNRKLAQYCKESGITVTAYRPIAEGRVAKDRAISRVAEKHSATAAQVSLAYLMQLGYVVIPTSGKAARIAENFGALGVTLDSEDMAAMRSADKNERYINPEWGPDWD